MNKKEFAKVYKKMSQRDITITKALDELEIFLETLTEALQLDGQVKFHQKGVFEILERKPRRVSNPVTKEIIEIYPKRTVKFRISKNIKY
ncbi:HU family DNA-binding protein [Fusobacterium varium]|uniref:HU family DNA-binding protein n=1 Tax=Fusobacterium varium TaxID=856 RepID=UPI000BBAA80F|nr:hypothetical protein FV113G1_33140 [Fusobacterium varium]